jgi:uncharacterized protein YrrD
LIIKLLGQPIVALHEAEEVGTVDGIIIDENKVSHIIHKSIENNLAVPIQNVIIGADAVMIQEISALTMASNNIKPLDSMLDVYNLNGRYLGALNGVETDKNYYVRYIITDEYRIEMSKVINYNNVIIVDAEESKLMKSGFAQQLEPDYETNLEKIKEKVDSNIDCNVVIPLKPMVQDGEAVQDVEASKAENVITGERQEDDAGDAGKDSDGEETVEGVDAKYAYLCGKELIEDIEINGCLYEKGMRINVELIRKAIENNAIVTLIVNAED